MTLVASFPREPVVPSRDHPQLPAGLQLGSCVQQCAPSVCGATGPGEVEEIRLLGCGKRGSLSGLSPVHPAAPLRLGQELQQKSVPGLGNCQQSPGEPWPEPGDGVSSHGCPASGAQGTGLGLRHWCECSGNLGLFYRTVYAGACGRAFGRICKP